MSKIPFTILTLSLVSALFAGCIGDDPVDTDSLVELPELDTLIELTHEVEDGHTMTEYHQIASDNMELIGYTNLGSDDVPVVGGNAEVSVHGEYAYVSTLGDQSGFAIVDISDPTTPTVVGRYSNPDVYSPDVKVTDDGKYALLSSHPGSTTTLPADPGLTVPRITNPVAYAEDEDHVAGVTLVDISDKTNPVKVATYLSEPNGVHNTEYANIDGRDLVFSVDRNNVAVLEILDGPAGTELRVIGQIFSDSDYRDSLPDKAGSTNYAEYLPQGSHDVVYEQHPITGDHVVHIAFGRAGYFMYQVNDPTRPSMLTHWKGLPADSSYYHYAAPLPILVDDRHITIVAPEVFGSDQGTGTMAFLDTTDPRQPVELGTWTLPGDDLFIERNYRFSPHNFDIDDTGRMYLANYHAGVLVLDFGCPNCESEPAFDGVYMPHQDPERVDANGDVLCAFWCERPFVWGVVQGDDGYLYASDVESGLYVIEHTPTIEERASVTEDALGTA